MSVKFRYGSRIGKDETQQEEWEMTFTDGFMFGLGFIAACGFSLVVIVITAAVINAIAETWG